MEATQQLLTNSGLVYKILAIDKISRDSIEALSAAKRRTVKLKAENRELKIDSSRDEKTIFTIYLEKKGEHEF